MGEWERITKVLQGIDRNLSATPWIKHIHCELYEDTSGDDSLKIWVIIDDKMDDKEITGEAVHAIKTTIRNRLSEGRVTRFPYFFFVREAEYESELRQAVNEGESEND